MANKKYKLSDDYWEASGIYDIGQSKTQRVINNDLVTGKANKSETVSTITYDSANHKLKKTINGTTTDVMTVDTTPTDNSMNPISSDAAYDLKYVIDAITPLDTVPTNGSSKGITSDSVKDAINVIDDNTPYSETIVPSSIVNEGVIKNAARVRVMTYNVAKYNNNTATPMPDEKVQNFRKLIDEYHPDFLCTQEDMLYYDNSSKDAVAYLYRPLLSDYYRAGTNYDINIHSRYSTATGVTNHKVMFTGVTSKSRAMQVCTFPVENSDKK